MRHLATLAMCLAAIPAASHAQRGSSSTGISATVAAVCAIEASPLVPPVDSKAELIWELVEMCNTDAYYGIVLQHRPLASGERAAVIYRGATVDLSPNGHTMLGRSSGPLHRESMIEMHASKLSSPLEVAVVMVLD